MKQFFSGIALILLCLTNASTEERAEDHQQLRELLTNVTRLMNEKRPSEISQYLTDDACLTFVDQTIVRNAAELASAFDKWLGPQSELQQVVFAPIVEHGTIFTGPDTGWSSGKSDDVYTLKDGRTATMTSHWTATVVKRDGRWKISTFHAGVDPQANPIIGAAINAGKRLVLWAAVIAGVFGLIIGAIAARAIKR